MNTSSIGSGPLMDLKTAKCVLCDNPDLDEVSGTVTVAPTYMYI